MTISSMTCVLAVAVAVAVLLPSMAAGQHSYIVTFPCTVRPGQDSLISVYVPSAASSVNVQAELRTTGGNVLGATAAVVAPRAISQVHVPTPSSVQLGAKLKLHVTGTGGLTFSNSSDVTVGKGFSLFVQTDKGAYRPGQTVRMRVISVLPTLRPFTGSLDVSISDPSSTRLAQWTGVQPANGIWSEDFPISTYPPLGNWSVSVTAVGASTSAVFEVREYTLPKFAVTVTGPPYVAKDESSDITAMISAKYTFGEAVAGTARVDFFLNRVYQYCGRGGASTQPTTRIQQQVKLTSGKSATATLTRAQLSSMFCSQSSFATYFKGSQQLVVNVTVTDAVSGEARSSSTSLGLYGVSRLLDVDTAVTPTSFKPGAKFPARFLFSTPDKKPISDSAITLKISGVGINSSTVPMMTRGGVASHVIAVPKAAKSLQLEAYPGTGSSSSVSYDQKAYSYPSRAISPTQSYLQLTVSKANFGAGETARFSAEASVNRSSLFTELLYSVYSRAALVHHSSVAPVTGATSVTFDVVMTSSMGPFAKVVAYYVVAGEVVVDSLSVSVEGVFENNVSVSFDAAEARPNANVTLSVAARPGSTVAISVVDQSALLVRQANSLTVAGVSAALASYDEGRQPGAYNGPVWALIEPFAFRRRRRSGVLPGPWYYGGISAGEILGNAGICAISDFNIPSGRSFAGPFGGGIPEGGFASDVGIQFRGPSGNAKTTTVGQSLALPDHTRDFFPETWLWATANASVSGRAVFPAVVPDTITSWVADAFAVSPTHGLGVSSSSAKLRAFQPYFISMNLPYSVVRGEELVLQINVFNYLDVDLETVVSLESPPGLRVSGVEAGTTAQKTINVLAGKSQSALFVVTPQSVGRVPLTVTAQSTVAADKVVRQLLVEPEGITKSYAHGVFIDLSNSTSLSQQINLFLPTDNLVPGSARAVISLVGDVMGAALSNLDQLLVMPYGCGEQNMLGFAPDVFITRYLTSSGKSTSAILAKAKRYMQSGYQRELRYWRADYSFSAFGNRDKVGSLWLTAFVVKSFSQAVPYVYIDPEVLRKSLSFLISRQNSDGSFPQVGMVHHSGLKGGLQGDAARTAYVLTTLIEARTVASLSSASLTTAISKTEAYLGRQLNLLTDNYTLALCAYALKLSDSALAPQALSLLLSRADRVSGTLHWQDSRRQQSAKLAGNFFRPPWRRAQSADVELTAYGLLALVLNKNLPDASAAARWLTAQRNARGGFDSTQDTVVALQALSEFAMLLSATTPAVGVTLSSSTAGSPFSQTFNMDGSNALVLQQTHDFPVPATLDVTATGSGVAVLSIEVYFNLKTDDVTAFAMNADCRLWKQGERLGATCKYCTRVSSAEFADTGMSLLEIGMPSGFSADMDTVNRALSAEPLAARVETPDRRVVFYLDAIGSDNVCFSIDLVQSLVVGKLQPSAIRTINYYNPSVSNANLYQISAEEVPLCCQCTTCDTCLSSGTSGLTCPQLGARAAEDSSAGRSAAQSVTAILAAVLAILLV